jgi:hypothetical protein
MSLHPGAPRYIFVALFAAAFLVMVDQAAEVLITLFPFQFGVVTWRFGAAGVIAGRTTTAVFLDALVLLAALGLERRRFLRWWGLFHFLVAAVLLAGGALFVLDAIELSNNVKSEAAGVLVLTGVRASLIMALGVIYCCWVGIASVRATRGGGAAGGSGRDGEDLLLVAR